jgi:predicted MFS family arabinose efflux permease
VSKNSALAPFRTRSFRFQWPADLCTAWALEMETLILGWYVLVESGSVVLLTAYGAMLYVGTLVAPLLGMLGDRVGLRRVLAIMRLSYALFAGVILLLAATHRLDPLMVLGVAFFAGLIKPTDIGLRTALVSAAVPPQHLVAAMGISRTTQDSARIGGALAGAGFMATLGMVSAYVVIASLYLLGALLTLRVGSKPAPGLLPAAPPSAPVAVRPSPWRDLKEGLLHVWQTPRLRAAMAVAALVNLTAFPLTGGLMPYVAREVFQLNQQGLGWLVASYASGALMGSLGLSNWGARLRSARTMMLGAVVWYLCLMGFALPISVPVAYVLLMGAGVAQSLSMISLSIILLRTSDERFRGRVMGARMLAIYTLPIGLLAAGPLIAAIGYRSLVALYGAMGLLLLAAIAVVWFHELWPRTALANAR